MLDKAKFANVEHFERAMSLPFSEVVRHASIVSDNVQGAIVPETESFTGTCHEMVRQAAERLRIVAPGFKYYVQGRRWFNGTHTYHSVRISDSNMDEIVYLPCEYGYGDQWAVTALEWFQKQGLIDMENRNPTIAFREILHADYSCTDVKRKRDL